MSFLFEREINNWNTWGSVYQSIEDFRSLIEEVFAREQLIGADHISPLKPGTNAVFKVGNYVIKIFAPSQSGLDTDLDYRAERTAMKRAIQQGIHTPSIVAAGTIEDKYVFKYLIMDYIEGQCVGDVFTQCTLEEKRQFIKQLQHDLTKMNKLPDEQFSREILIDRVVNNERWHIMRPEVIKQIADFLSLLEIRSFVHVHGDLTGDNVLINSEGQVYIIDFADSTIAPIEYEFPPIIFELLHSDIDGILEFIKGLDMKYNEFIDQLFAGTLMHDFGANFVKAIYEKYTGRDIGELTDIYEIKRLLHKHLLPNSLNT